MIYVAPLRVVSRSFTGSRQRTRRHRIVESRIISVKAEEKFRHVKTVQDNLGHATAAFTLDVYGHVSARMKEESARRQEEYIQRLRSEKQA